MNEEKYFLKAISKGEPNADLVYADWLEEQGRPEADEIRVPAIIVSRSYSCYSKSCSQYLSGPSFGLVCYPRPRFCSQSRSWYHPSNSRSRYCSLSVSGSRSHSRSYFRTQFRYCSDSRCCSCSYSDSYSRSRSCGRSRSWTRT